MYEWFKKIFEFSQIKWINSLPKKALKILLYKNKESDEKSILLENTDSLKVFFNLKYIIKYNWTIVENKIIKKFKKL